LRSVVVDEAYVFDHDIINLPFSAAELKVIIDCYRFTLLWYDSRFYNCKIAVASTKLHLGAKILSQRSLAKEGVDIIVEVAIGPPSVTFQVKLSRTESKSVTGAKPRASISS